ncbi:hypothetical protein EIM92_06380 [Paenibacillus lentus]|uniref:Uncharacterized protein n=2 Tax=Paenibacillus lentus TaxID=1338368 RepID=A0A3S8RSU7_9BACL|nr:hypothetical protein EIM92_06380 [Paenibacillus lentus]
MPPRKEINSPSGLVQQIQERVQIDIKVMIRPHSCHFFCDKENIATMLQDTAKFRHLSVPDS